MIKSLLGLAITLSTLISPGICAGAVASPAPAVIVESSESLMLALKDANVETIVLNGEGLCVTRLSVKWFQRGWPRPWRLHAGSTGGQVPALSGHNLEEGTAT